MTDWHDYVHSDPHLLLGKPVVKGTRLSVEFLLGLYSEGWSERQVLENYPSLSPDSLKAVFSFVAECMREEALYSNEYLDKQEVASARRRFSSHARKQGLMTEHDLLKKLVV